MYIESSNRIDTWSRQTIAGFYTRLRKAFLQTENRHRSHWSQYQPREWTARVEYVFYAHRIRISRVQNTYFTRKIRISRTEDALCAHRKRIALIARTENALLFLHA